jgi:hypothetical protein
MRKVIPEVPDDDDVPPDVLQPGTLSPDPAAIVQRAETERIVSLFSPMTP